MTIRKRVSLYIARVQFVIEMVDNGQSIPTMRYTVDGQRVEAADFDRCMRMVETGASVTLGTDADADDVDVTKVPIS